MEDDVLENEELVQRADNLTNYEEAIPVLKEYETITRSTKKDMLNIAYIQGIIFKKFKESDKVVERIKEIGVSKSTINFKMKLVKILDKYPKLKTSLFLLNFFKDCLKTIKEICKESGSEFS